MARSTWPDGELSAAGKLNTWPDHWSDMPKSIKVGVSESVETPKSIEVGRSGSARAAKIGRACARGAPRSVQGCAEVTKISAKSCRGSTNARVRTHRSFANYCWGDFLSKRVAFRRCCRACQPSQVPCLPAKPKVRHIVLQDKLLTRCSTSKNVERR